MFRLIGPKGLFLCLLLCGWLMACSQPSPAAVATFTPTPGITPLPTHTRQPTATTLSAPPTDAPIPTATAPLPTAVPSTELPTAVPFVPPDGFLDPANFPTGVNPLTGLAIAQNRAAQRPIAVKISNYPPVVRPQWGLNSADLVFEHYAEGGVTRFTALFYGNEAERVGSVRSGRLIDLEIPRMYDAAFAYSGASGPVRLLFQDSAFFDRIISPDFGHGGFERLSDGEQAFEHTLFTNTYTLHYLLGLREENRPPVLQNQMAFSRGVPAGGTAVRQIEIRYDGTNAFWSYANGRYQRWTDGQPHLDAATEEQLTFANIVVVAAHHEETDILEDNVGDGNYSIQIQVWGEGPVSIFRDGQRFDGRWMRQSPDDMITFVDEQGYPIPLAQGNTFFQMVPLGFDGLVVE